MAINTIIVDDEKPARDELAFLLRGFPEINVIGQGKNGVEAVSLIKEYSPDLVFLDVKMPGLDGFGVLKKIVERKMKMPHVVFATAFDEYAVQAFDVNAVDYVLKPFDKARIAKAIARARKMLETQTSATERLEQLVSQLGAVKQNSSPPVRLLVKSQQKLLLVDGEDLVFASIEDGIISMMSRDAEGTSNYRTLEELNAALDSDSFWRPHRSYLVVLAAAPLVPGEHPPHQGSCAVVQIQLHAENERQKAHRNPGEPLADQTHARIVQSVERKSPHEFARHYSYLRRSSCVVLPRMCWAKSEVISRIGVENFADFAGKGVQFKRLFEVMVAVFGNAPANGGIVGVTGHE